MESASATDNVFVTDGVVKLRSLVDSRRPILISESIPSSSLS